MFLTLRLDHLNAIVLEDLEDLVATLCAENEEVVSLVKADGAVYLLRLWQLATVSARKVA